MMKKKTPNNNKNPETINTYTQIFVVKLSKQQTTIISVTTRNNIYRKIGSLKK